MHVKRVFQNLLLSSTSQKLYWPQIYIRRVTLVKVGRQKSWNLYFRWFIGALSWLSKEFSNLVCCCWGFQVIQCLVLNNHGKHSGITEIRRHPLEDPLQRGPPVHVNGGGWCSVSYEFLFTALVMRSLISVIISLCICAILFFSDARRHI